MRENGKRETKKMFSRLPKENKTKGNIMGNFIKGNLLRSNLS